ncbi:chemotaxis protein CheD [Rhizobium laguerreae]|uniref:chemotaxis protein CheD n=1 Tax=Rhizobium laguerreae TaxID=1076926 RepID=UPI001C9178DD|nr:chemotaxis protein CheD [Rhizobium laguerreae]MBY3155367.1 chemotaxis protein CheD [Rhizobium laguerreae]
MDMQIGLRRLELFQGEYRVTSDWRISLSTVLGSCVAVCLLDPVAGVAGMNHFLLPHSPNPRGAPDARYGDFSMRMMLATMLARGATINDLQAKVYGGAATLSTSCDVGERNVEFALAYLDRERIPVFGGCVGGGLARRITFIPGDGDVVLHRRPTVAANTVRSGDASPRFAA